MPEQHRVEPAWVPVRYPFPPPAERHLVRAAAAVAAGRSKGALRELRQSEHDRADPDQVAVHESLYLAALALDLNWAPDDAGLVRPVARPGPAAAAARDYGLLAAWATQAIHRQRGDLLDPATAVICVLGAEVIPAIRIARAQLLADPPPIDPTPVEPPPLAPPARAAITIGPRALTAGSTVPAAVSPAALSPAAGPASPPTVLDTSPDGLTTRPIVLAEAPTTPMITVFAAPRPPDGDVPPAATDAPSADSQAPPSDSDAPPPPSTAPPAAPRSAPDAGFPSPESYLPMYLGWSGSSGLARQPAADREAHRTAPRGRGLLPAMLGRGGRRVSGPDETPTPGKGLSASADTLALPRGVTPPLPPLPAFPPPLSSPPDRAPRRPALSAALAAPSEEPAGGPDPAQPAPAPLSLMPPRPRPRPRHLRPEAADATTGPDATAGPRGTAVAVPPPSQAGGEGGLRAPTAGEMAAQALSAADAFVGRLAELPVRQASAYGTILRADLLFRMGREADANRALDVVESAGDVDDATLAHAALVRGDWAGYPDGGAQTLSRGWDGTPIPPARPAYRDRAEELWRRSLAAYGRVGSDSGRAAGLLRLADAPTAIGRPILRRARIDEAARRARSAGNDALTWTARLHSLIERARSGEASTAELATMMTALVEWSRFDGSTTFGGGLRCLLSAATGVPQPADDA